MKDSLWIILESYDLDQDSDQGSGTEINYCSYVFTWLLIQTYVVKIDMLQRSYVFYVGFQGEEKGYELLKEIALISYSLILHILRNYIYKYWFWIREIMRNSYVVM